VYFSHTHSGGGARAWVEDGQLTKHIRWAHHGEEVLTAVSGVASELHLAGGDDVQAVTWLVLFEDGSTAWEAYGLQLLDQVIYSHWIDALENASAGEDVVYTVHFAYSLVDAMIIGLSII
jgi:hypothetical protein